MDWDLQRVRQNVTHADTEDLLDRITVYRGGMEPEAVALIEDELASRGVSADEIERHDAERRARAIMLPDGTARPCSFCDRPAVMRAWAWHKMWGRLPAFPRVFSYCDVHSPLPRGSDDF
jgi:hypothetical protein